MKKLIIPVVMLLTGCATNSEPFCTAYVKTYELSAERHYELKIRDARKIDRRYPVVELKTKYGWWELGQFDLKYGNCAVKLKEAGYL